MPFSFAEARAGARDVAPMLLGVIPFGLVAGATPAAQGLPKWSAVGFSTIVFAGTSQLAAIDVLGHGGTVLVAVMAAWTINLRMVLYSASMAPYLTDAPLSRRLVAAYLVVDQNYAAAVTRWAEDGGADWRHRLAYFLGGGALLWTCWNVSTVVGVLVGGALPEDAPLDFALPLVFLVLLMPVLTNRASVAAAAVGGTAAVVAAELGAGGAAIVIGCACGIAAGAIAETMNR